MLSSLKQTIVPLAFLILTALSSGLVFHSQERRGAEDKQQTQAQKRTEFKSQFPVAHYSATESVDVNKREKRRIKGGKYNKSLDPLTPDTQVNLSSLDWEVGLSALPVDKSQAVIIGEVVGAEAYVSNDKTGVYSEFTVRVDEILKNNSNVPLAIGNKVDIERPGGRVEFPSGQVALVYTRAQGMPRIGKRYVFFLSHDFPLQGHQSNDLYILTGYELHAGRVIPLDEPPDHPITTYKGRDTESFLEDLRSALANLQ